MFKEEAQKMHVDKEFYHNSEYFHNFIIIN